MEALTEEESKKLEKVVELYINVKELLLYAEELREESFLPPILELRDAFDHLIRVFQSKTTSKNNEYAIKNLDATFRHLYRAMFQLMDYVRIRQHEWIVESLNDISNTTIVTVFPEYYSEIKPELDVLINELPTFRRGLSRSEWELGNTNLDSVKKYLENINKIKLIFYRINKKLPALHEFEGRIRLDYGSYLTKMESKTLPENDTSIRIQQESAESIIHSKIRNKSYDVFLCYNSSDKPAVKEIGEELKREGILPWLDVWELRPGLPWQRLLEEQIEKIKSAAVFVGANGEGPWQKMEIETFLREFIRRGCPVIPVLLSDAKSEPNLPIFLNCMTWVDFRRNDPDPIGHLIWGITGKRADFIQDRAIDLDNSRKA